MRIALPFLLLLLTAAPGLGREKQKEAPEPPPLPEVLLPPGVDPPDLSGYRIVEVNPEMPSDQAFELFRGLPDEGALAVLFAPGDYRWNYKAWKKLWRHRRGLPERPQYIGPSDRTKPLPRLETSASLAGSGNLLIQGLVFRGVGIGGIANHPDGLPVTVEGCWISGGVRMQSSRDHGELRPPGKCVFRRCWIMDAEGQGVYSDHSSDCRLIECVIDRSGSSPTREHSVYLSHTRNFVIERCVITRPSSSAFKDNASEGAVIRDCLIAGAQSWASINANPKEGTKGEQGSDFLAEGNIVTAMHRRDGRTTGTGFFGWSYRNLTIRNNLFVRNGEDATAAPIQIRPPFYNRPFAGPCENMLVEGNVLYAYRGHMIRVLSGTDFHGLTVRNNVVAEPESWEGTTAHTNPLSLPGATPEEAEKLGLEFTGNLWPRWVPLSPVAAIVGGRTVQVTFRNAGRDLGSLAKSLGEEATEEGFYRALRKRPPPQVIDTALRHFREGYAVKEVREAPPPDSVPWLGEEESDSEATSPGREEKRPGETK